MPDSIPPGLCQCGCGQQTDTASCTRRALGQVKGEPLRFVQGHHLVADPLTRFLAKVNKTGTCWLWTGRRIRAGYGMFSLGDRSGGLIYAHRWSYEHHVAPIPDGLVIDHLCRNPPCVNPAHLEPVTQAENTRRGDRATIQRDGRCLRDLHDVPKTEKVCRECRKLRKNQRYRETHPDFKERDPSVCANGHDRSEHGYVNKNGHWMCHECNRVTSKAWRARKAAANG